MEKIPDTHNVTAVGEDSKAPGSEVHNDHKPGGRKPTETISSLAGTIAFAAAAYGSGNYFSVLSSYDPIMAGSATAIAVIGSVIVLAANHYGKSR